MKLFRETAALTIDAAKLATYARFLGISDKDREAARIAWRAVVEPVFGKLLNRFYDRLLRSPMSRLLEGHEIEHIKHKQHDYWALLFGGTLDERYFEQSRRIAMVHRRHGISMAEYIGSNGWLSEKLLALIARHGPGDAEDRQLMLSAVHKLVFLDMMIASHAYGEADTGRDDGEHRPPPPDDYPQEIVEID